MNNSTTLYDLNEYLKRVIALNFQEPVWVSCEISQVSEVRGQVYMDVVQQDEDTNEVVAKSSAVIWYKSYLFIKNKLKELLPSILTVGTHVLLKVKIEYNERYGIKLVIEDIDPSYTIGQMEMARQKILQRLAEADVMDINRSLPLPRVISRIAIISSATAAGYKDFTAQLDTNEYGYKYKATLYKAAMQGQNTEREVCQALDDIADIAHQYDCVVIIRGGGSKLDLSGFDSYNIGHKIATAPLPILTGIGHEIDQSVADLTSHTSFKTPTAVAAYIIDHNVAFEAEIVQMGQWIGQVAKHTVTEHKSTLDQITQLLRIQPKTALNQATMELEQLNSQLKQSAKYAIREINESIGYAEKVIKIADPVTTLKRGYAMIQIDGKVITSAKKLKKGQQVTVTYTDGEKLAEIIK